LQHLRR